MLTRAWILETLALLPLALTKYVQGVGTSALIWSLIPQLAKNFSTRTGGGWSIISAALSTAVTDVTEVTAVTHNAGAGETTDAAVTRFCREHDCGVSKARWEGVKEEGARGEQRAAWS